MVMSVLWSVEGKIVTIIMRYFNCHLLRICVALLFCISAQPP